MGRKPKEGRPKGEYSDSPAMLWREDIRAAKELCYPKIVVELLEREENPRRRANILADARHGVYDRLEKQTNKNVYKRLQRHALPIKCLNTGVVYPTIRAFAEDMFLSPSAVSKALNNGTNETKGVKFEIAEDYSQI